MDKKSNKIINLLKNFKSKAKKIVDVESLILFGSRARGNEKENSDVDLIIVSKDFEGQKSFKRPAKFYVAWDNDYNTDIICLTPQELEIKRKQISIIKNAMKEGITI